jgi:DNA-binding NarL/FixJ family response regulator
MIYVISDDYYFSLGVQTVFAETDQNIRIIPYSDDDWIPQIRQLTDTDILLLAVENTAVLRIILRMLSAKRTRVSLFLKNISSSDEFIRQTGVIRRQIPVESLIKDVTQAIRHNGARKVVNHLTFSQRFVLESLTRGSSLSKIAETLHISEKMVYGHKSNALNRLGLTSEMNCRNLLIYSCLAQFGGDYINEHTTPLHHSQY